MAGVIFLCPLLLTSFPCSPQGHGDGNDDRVLPLHLHHSGKVSQRLKALLPLLLSLWGSLEGPGSRLGAHPLHALHGCRALLRGGEKQGEQDQHPKRGESRARPSFGLKPDNLVIPILPPQPCLSTYCERLQSLLRCSWMAAALWSRTDLHRCSLWFYFPSRSFDFSAATRTLKDEQTGESVRLLGWDETTFQ